MSIIPKFIIDAEIIAPVLKKRTACQHKGSFGHAFLWIGSYGKMGAAVLSAKACLRSGAGLLSVQIPKCGYDIMQVSVPEAMVFTDRKRSKLSEFVDVEAFTAFGLGPGIGRHKLTKSALISFLETNTKPCVLDADALNLLSEMPEFYFKLNENYILTPHPKEFERLTGHAKSDWERIEKATKFVADYGCILILKGGFTSIHLPEDEIYFNKLGNPGMATAGSGDVLTGLLTGLLAQGYTTKEAAILGVYIHALSGDFAAENYTQQALIAGDLPNFFAAAFKEIYGY